MSTESEQNKAARKAAEKMAHVTSHSAAQTRSRVKAAAAHSDAKSVDKSVEKSSDKTEHQAHRSTAELRGTAMAARAELASTLDAIEFKLNVPKQIGRAHV